MLTETGHYVSEIDAIAFIHWVASQTVKLPQEEKMPFFWVEYLKLPIELRILVSEYAAKNK